jgi:anti-sigma-K factor RskA
VSEQHPVEALAAYALESLGEAERARVEAHVASCATCGRHLAEYRAVVGALPTGLEPVTPPPAAWAAIRAAARERRPRLRRWARVGNWLRLARWPALAVAAVALVAWNVLLQRELTRLAPGPAPGPEVEALARRPGQVVIFSGTGVPDASARLFVAADGGHGHLAVAGLPLLPRDRVYQLWFLRGGLPAVSGATFAVNAHGRAWVKVVVPASLDGVRAIAVTEESAPGSPAPKGRQLLDARSCCPGARP